MTPTNTKGLGAATSRPTITKDWLRIMLVALLLVGLVLWLILRRDRSKLEVDSRGRLLKSKGGESYDEFGSHPTTNAENEKQMSGSRAKGRIAMVNEWW